MTIAEKYDLKKLTSTKGLKIGDLLGDSSVLGYDSDMVVHNEYIYTIQEILDEGKVKLTIGGTYSITYFFAFKDIKKICKETHPLTKRFLSDENYKKYLKSKDSENLKESKNINVAAGT